MSKVSSKMRQILIFSLLAGISFANFKQGNDCTELRCDDQPGTVCQMIVYDCTVAPCPPSAECVPMENSCSSKKCAKDQKCIVRRPFCSSEEPGCKHRTSCVKYPKCGKNEEYRECSGEGSRCESTCESFYPSCNPAGCGKGDCVCEFGFVRSKGKCIKQEQCPDPDCPANMVWSKCPGYCEQPTCRSILSKKKEVCTEGCGFARCICAPGYVKNDEDVCVLTETCPKKFDCPSASEELKQCSVLCEPSCWNRNPVCAKKCGPPKCQCKPGHVRDNGYCLPSGLCPHLDPMPSPISFVAPKRAT